MKIKLNRKSIFIQLIIVFFIVIFILFGIAYSIYLWGINIIREEFINEASVQNKNFSDNLDNEFKRISMLQFGIVDDWDLKKLSTMPNKFNAYEQSLMLLRLKDKILAVKTSSKLIDEIGIIIPQVEKTVKTSAISNISQETIKKYEEYAKFQKERIIYIDDRLMLISQFPECYYEDEIEFAPSYIIHTDISKNALQKFLGDMSNFKDSNEFIVSERRNMIIANNDDSSVTSKIKDIILTHEGEEINFGNKIIKDTYYLQEKIDGEKYIIVYTDTGLDDIKLVRYLSENIAFSGLEKYNLIMWIFAVTALLTIVIFSNSLYKKIHYPLRKLVKAIEKVKNADLTVTIKHRENDEFKYIYESFNDMVLKINDLIEEVYTEKLLVEKANLKQLQTQINPHFLYNSFLILRNRIQIGDNEFAEEFCRELGQYFMFITRNKLDEVPLKYEVEHAVIYCNIQHARFFNRLEMQLETLPVECENISVPRLILQPILENAFEHSLEKIERNCFLHLGYELHEDFLDIIVEDNGDEIDEDKIKALRANLENTEIEVTGMINIHQRLKLTYSKDFGLNLSQSELGGLKVRLRLPRNNMEG